MILLPQGVEIGEVPIERRYSGVLRGLLTRIKGLYEAIYERYGDDGLELIRSVSSGYGAEIARRSRRGDPPWEIRKVGLYLVKVFDNMQSDGEVTEFTDRRVAILVPRCPYPFEHTQICAAHTSMERALVQGLNPDLDYCIENSIPAGDPFCLHVLKWK